MKQNQSAHWNLAGNSNDTSRDTHNEVMKLINVIVIYK